MSQPPPDQPPEPVFTTGPLRWRTPVGRHQHTGRVRVGALLAALATAVVVVVVGGAVSDTELSVDERFRVFVNTGAMGEPVSAQSFQTTVLGARTAAQINTDPGAGVETAGVWVLVQVRAVALEESMWIKYAAVRDSGGRTWLATPRFEQPLVDGGYRLDPGIPVEAEVAFEVPREAATDLTVRLGKGANGLYGFQMATVAEVPVPLDEAAVADGLAATEPIVLERPEIVIADPPVLVGVPEPGDE
jgi:hypothetical protein